MNWANWNDWHSVLLKNLVAANYVYVYEDDDSDIFGQYFMNFVPIKRRLKSMQSDVKKAVLLHIRK